MFLKSVIHETDDLKENVSVFSFCIEMLAVGLYFSRLVLLETLLEQQMIEPSHVVVEES